MFSAKHKQQSDFVVLENRSVHSLYSLIILKPKTGTLPEINPGQFVQVKVPDSSTTFLRRPISINRVDYNNQTIWLLIRKAGDGTRKLTETTPGSTLNIVLPLGNGFDDNPGSNRLLLAGGGVGIAPMLYLGERLKINGYKPEFLIGARSKDDLLEMEYLTEIGTVHVSTDDGSMGEHGLITSNSVLSQPWDKIYCCGPAPMMKAVAKTARAIKAECYVSLENMMACGVGACLCCVENTVKGNVCVCTEGPVFNINDLTWQD